MDNLNHVEPTFYPAYCFKASPTHFAWVKMAISDVHRLHKPKGFEGQKLFFYKNHPITFVTVVGVIVARTEITRRTILTMDDSSGATLDIIVNQADPKEKLTTENAQVSYPTASSASAITNANTNANSTAFNLPNTSTETEDMQTLLQVIHVSFTDRTIIDISKLLPGTMIKAKGTINTFRSVMQMNLERFEVLHDTNAEMKFIDERLRFFVEVLSIPWELSDEEIEHLRHQALEMDLKTVEKRKRDEKKLRYGVEREEKDQRHILRQYEREEKKRAKSAGVSKEAGVKAMHDIRKKRVFSGVD